MSIMPGFYAISPAHNPLSGANSIKWILDNYTGIRSRRMLRGGAWGHPASSARVANRNSNVPWGAYIDYGFRCARAVE